MLSGVVVSAASLAEDEWKRILLDQIDSLRRLRAQRAVPVRWIMEIRSLLTPAFQNSTRALQYHGTCTGGPTQNSASGQISVSEKAKKCMENEKVLRLRISDEK